MPINLTGCSLFQFCSSKLQPALVYFLRTGCRNSCLSCDYLKIRIFSVIVPLRPFLSFFLPSFQYRLQAPLKLALLSQCQIHPRQCCLNVRLTSCPQQQEREQGNASIPFARRQISCPNFPKVFTIRFTSNLKDHRLSVFLFLFSFSAVLRPMPYISFTGSGQNFVGMSSFHSFGDAEWLLHFSCHFRKEFVFGNSD